MGNYKYSLDFEVARTMIGDKHGEATVYCNGHFVESYTDHIENINPGQKYYGKMVNGKASIVPDMLFIRAALFPSTEGKSPTIVKLLLEYEEKQQKLKAKKGTRKKDPDQKTT